jgi:hypothetical protein
VAQLGQVEFSRIGPLLAEFEEELLTPPAPSLIARIAAVDRVQSDDYFVGAVHPTQLPTAPKRRR